MLSWTYTGVNTSIEGAGGQSCINYITTKRRFFESACVCITFLYTLYWSYLKFSVGNPRHSNEQTKLRQILLVLHTFVFGIEIGFKLATSTLIWILNPCHIITMLQVIRFELLHLFVLLIFSIFANEKFYHEKSVKNRSSVNKIDYCECPLLCLLSLLCLDFSVLSLVYSHFLRELFVK